MSVRRARAERILSGTWRQWRNRFSPAWLSGLYLTPAFAAACPIPEFTSSGIVLSLVLEGGGTLKEVADMLRHRNLETSQIYAKVDLQRLSEVTMPWPGSHS